MFTRLTPILPVVDVQQELSFYEHLGLRQHTDPAETYPVEEFAAVTDGRHILFGLARHTDTSAVPAAGLDWQLEATDLDWVDRAATSAGLEITQPVTVQPWGRRAMTIRSPSGYLVTVEETPLPGQGSDVTAIRPATGDDITAVLELWGHAAENASRPVDTSEAVAALIERDPAALLVAEDGGAVVGTVIAGWDGWRAHLYRLAVHPDRRRQGIGQALLAAAEQRLVQLGAGRFDAMVLDDNELGHRLWEGAGYVRQDDWARWVKPSTASTQPAPDGR